MKKFKETLMQKISELEEKEPKKYWNLVNELRTLETRDFDCASNIQASNWENYYKQLLNVKTVPDWDAELIPKLDEQEREKYFKDIASKRTKLKMP